MALRRAVAMVAHRPATDDERRVIQHAGALAKGYPDLRDELLKFVVEIAAVDDNFALSLGNELKRVRKGKPQPEIVPHWFFATLVDWYRRERNMTKDEALSAAVDVWNASVESKRSSGRRITFDQAQAAYGRRTSRRK